MYLQSLSSVNVKQLLSVVNTLCGRVKRVTKPRDTAPKKLKIQQYHVLYPFNKLK